jgi:alkylation response protein AidB-like acyl-CoA dehydrogenase
MMRDSVKEFVDKELWAHKDVLKKRLCLYRGVYEKAGDLGLLGVAVPEAYGGLEWYQRCWFAITFLVHRIFLNCFGAHTGIGTMPITLYGTEEQKTKYVPKLASGEWFGAYCLTEPGAGSDANSGKNKAVLSEDGNIIRLPDKKCGSLMQVSVLCLSYLLVLR